MRVVVTGNEDGAQARLVGEDGPGHALNLVAVARALEAMPVPAPPD
jgi:hypothetical protein